jgi:hypothetical protein
MSVTGPPAWRGRAMAYAIMPLEWLCNTARDQGLRVGPAVPAP